jgi:hypothetical protein
MGRSMNTEGLEIIAAWHLFGNYNRCTMGSYKTYTVRSFDLTFVTREVQLDWSFRGLKGCDRTDRQTDVEQWAPLPLQLFYVRAERMTWTTRVTPGGVNPLPVQFKSLLPGQDGCVFFRGQLNTRTCHYVLRREVRQVAFQITTLRPAKGLQGVCDWNLSEL